MSVALAIRRNGSTWLASDSAAFSGSHTLDHGPKFILHGGLGIAHTGCIRAWQAIAARLSEFDHDLEWRTKDAIAWGEWSRGVLRKFGAPKEGDHNRMPSTPIDNLLATPRRIFNVSPNGSVVLLPRFGAIGAGRAYAVGVLEALWKSGYSTREIARRAVEVTIRHCADVGGRPWSARIQ